jgi:hypothetical protein
MTNARPAVLVGLRAETHARCFGASRIGVAVVMASDDDVQNRRIYLVWWN